jgi:signal transduction histidine kinase
VHGAFQDISEYKLAEKKLKENEASLRELNATKDKFFSIIAHDLRSPFNAILGYSDILEKQIQENNFDGIEKYSQIINKSSAHTIDLLSDLMDWSRSQTGIMKFCSEDINLVDLISQITTLLNYAAVKKSITIHTELPHDVFVSADKAMVSTILRNLISNAIKFTKPGGEIIISTEQKLDKLIVSVSDNGVGIKPKAIKKLFRIDGNYSTIGTQNEKGTGLGLILCKNFIEKHGGEIWVESELGKGSRFWYFKKPYFFIDTLVTR